MKAIVLENGFKQDVPEELTDYLKERNIEWEWFDMRFSFYPENRVETMKVFSEFPVGQTFYVHTTFEDYVQLEYMILLLDKLKHKNFSLYIDHGCLAKDFLDFYNEEESSITPDELTAQLEDDLTDEESEKVYELIYAFKKGINEKFLEVLKAHNIYWITYDDVLFKSLDDIKKEII
jgi:hypothetical protein